MKQLGSDILIVQMVKYGILLNKMILMTQWALLFMPKARLLKGKAQSRFGG